MGQKRVSLEFWEGFEKEAGIMGQIASTLTGRGKAYNRLQSIRATSPGFGKPQGFISQFMKGPSNAIANATAQGISKHQSLPQKALRIGGAGIIGAGAVGYGLARQKEGDNWYGQQQ